MVVEKAPITSVNPISENFIENSVGIPVCKREAKLLLHYFFFFPRRAILKYFLLISCSILDVFVWLEVLLTCYTAVCKITCFPFFSVNSGLKKVTELQMLTILVLSLFEELTWECYLGKVGI